MQETNITVYLGVPMPSNELFNIGTNRSRTTLYEMLDELCQLSGQLYFYFFEIGNYSPAIELIDEAERKQFDYQFTEMCEILKMSIQILFPSDKPLYSESPNVQRFIVKNTFLKQISDLLVMPNLARVGSIELSKSIVLQDGVL